MLIENWNVVADPDSNEVPQRLILTGIHDGDPISIAGITDVAGPAGQERAFDIEGNVHELGVRAT